MSSVRVLLFLVLAVLACVAVAKDEPQSVEKGDLAAFKASAGKSLGPVNLPLLRFINGANNGSLKANGLTADLDAEFATRADKYGTLYKDISTRLNDVLGRTVAEDVVTKPNFASAKDTCPVVVHIINKMMASVPFSTTVVDKSGKLLSGVQLFGYIVSHSIADSGCRSYFQLMQLLQQIDSVHYKYLNSIDKNASDTAADVVELWSELRQAVVTYITTVGDQLQAKENVSLDGLNKPEDETTAVAMMQAAEMLEALETPIEITDEEKKLESDILKLIEFAKSVPVRDEL